MTAYISGHEQDPSDKLKKAFEGVAEQMKDLPFLHPHVKIQTLSFQVYEGQWVGAVLTPWMLSICILPGPGQEWPWRKVSTKIGVSFPRKDLPFIASEIDGVGQYLSCSLMSPLRLDQNPVMLAELAKESVAELLKETDTDEPAQKSRRMFILRQES